MAKIDTVIMMMIFSAAVMGAVLAFVAGNAEAAYFAAVAAFASAVGGTTHAVVTSSTLRTGSGRSVAPLGDRA